MKLRQLMQLHWLHQLLQELLTLRRPQLPIEFPQFYFTAESATCMDVKRLNRLGICMSSDSVINMHEKMGENFDYAVKKWKKEIEDNNSTLQFLKEIEVKLLRVAWMSAKSNIFEISWQRPNHRFCSYLQVW